MRSFVMAAALVAVAVVPAAAQHQHQGHGGGGMPAGWQGRVDRENQNIAEVMFMTHGSGFHVKTGPHVILWDPSRTAQGAYRASVTFTQAQAPERLEGYGILVGGRDLDQPGQDYLYFLIRHDGQYLIRHRAGTEVHTLAEWTPNAAIRKAAAGTPASNTVTIESLDNRVRFLVNGTEVHALDRVPMLNTNGIVGLRVGHHLDVMVDSIEVQPAGR